MVNQLNHFRIALIWLILASCTSQHGKVDFPFEETEFKKPKTVEAKPTYKDIPDSLPNSKYTTEKGQLVLRERDTPLKKPIAKKAGKPVITKNRLTKHTIPTDLIKRAAGIPNKVKTSGVTVPAHGKMVKARLPISKPYMPLEVSDRDTYGLRYISQDQNLPGTAVYALLEDSHGRIWIGTDNGLAMLEGGEIKIFTTQEGLSNINITSLLESSTGAIWIGTDGGVDVLESGSFTHYGVEEGLSNNFVNSLLESSTGEIWIGTYGGVDVFESGSFKHYGVEEGLSDNRVWSLLETTSGAIWIGTSGGGINVFESDSFKHYGVKEGLSDNRVWSLMESSSGAIWIGTYGGGVDVFESGNFIHYGVEEGLSSNLVVGLLESATGAIWIATADGGLDVFESNSFLHYGEEEGLSYNGVLSLLESSSGAVWVGTYGGGVDVFQSRNFHHYGMKEGLGNDFVVSLLESSSGAIWIGDNGGGLDVFQSESFLHYSTEEGLGDNYVSSLLETSTGAIWIGTDEGIDIFESGNFIHYGTEQGLSNNYVTSLLETSTGAIWIGTDGGGLNVFDSGSFIHYGQEEGLSNNTVRRLLEDSSGTIWIGTDGGVDAIKSGSFLHYGTQEGLSNNTVRSLLEDTSGAIWIGTSGGGIDIFESGSFTNYGTQQGLANNAVLQLAMDSVGNVWAGTGKGLTRFVRKGEGYQLTSWNKTHGLKYMDFNSPGNPMLFTKSDQISKKGTMWTGVGGVLTSFEPPMTDNLKPTLFLTGIDIEHKLVDWSKLSSLKEKMEITEGINSDTLFFPNRDRVMLFSNLPPDTSYLNRAGIVWSGVEDSFPYVLPQNLELPYDQNHLTFHYSGLKLNEQFDVVYRYILEGMDDKWSPFTRENKVDYRNIPYGNYTFKVRARGRNFIWSDEVSISFVVHPPWWLSWWAKILWVGLFATLLYSTYRIRITRLQKQKRQLEKVVKTRTKEVVQQKDEIQMQAKELITQAEELKAQNEENIALNDQLELRVKERTISLEESNRRLIEYAHNNSHMIRGPLARLLGLTYLSKITKSNDVEEIKDLMNKIEESGKELDNVIRETGKKLTEETGINPLNDVTEE